MSSTPNSAAEASTTSSSPASCMASNNNAPKYGTRVPNRVFVGGLSADTTESEMELLFSTYGTVTSVKIISDRAGVSKGYGFITFETEDQANSLVRMNEVYLKNRKLNIAPAIKKQYDPLGSLPTTYGRSSYDPSPSPNVPNGSVYYSSSGIPYTFQNSGLSYYQSNAAAAAAAAVSAQQQEAYTAAYSQHQQQAASTPAAYSSYPYMYPNAAATAAAAQAMYAAPQQYSYQMPTQIPHQGVVMTDFCLPYGIPVALLPVPANVNQDVNNDMTTHVEVTNGDDGIADEEQLNGVQSGTCSPTSPFILDPLMFSTPPPPLLIPTTPPPFYSCDMSPNMSILSPFLPPQIFSVPYFSSPKTPTYRNKTDNYRRGHGYNNRRGSSGRGKGGNRMGPSGDNNQYRPRLPPRMNQGTRQQYSYKYSPPPPLMIPDLDQETTLTTNCINEVSPALLKMVQGLQVN